MTNRNAARYKKTMTDRWTRIMGKGRRAEPPCQYSVRLTIFRAVSVTDGKVDMLIDRRNNEDVVWKKIG